MTAGHNALRGSGPGQKPVFDDAMAVASENSIHMQEADCNHAAIMFRFAAVRESRAARRRDERLLRTACELVRMVAEEG
jgi:hypothetical protein